MSVCLLRILCIFAVACPTHVTSIPSTVSPKDTYSQYLQSLAGQQQQTLGTTRPPASYPVGSYAHALEKGNFYLKQLSQLVEAGNVIKNTLVNNCTISITFSRKCA